MKKEAATVAIVLNMKEAKKRYDGRRPVKLRVTYKRDYKFYALIYRPEDANNARKAGKEPIWEPGEVIAMTEEEYAKVFARHPREAFLPKNVFLTELRNSAIKVIESLGEGFTFDKFDELYLSNPKDKNDLFSIMASTARQLRTDGRISTAITFEFGVKSLKDFSEKDKFPFERVTVKFLKEYEKWMLTPRVIEWKTKGDKTKSRTKVNGRTTVGIYLRNVRTMFNQVKPVGVLYPFGKSKQGLYAIPKGKNVKKALTQADVAKIANYASIKGTIEQRSRDLWLFSYLCNGINFKDIARLKYSNINSDKISLVRAKTAESTDEEPSIQIMITRQIGRIIDIWGNKPATRDNYIFPVLLKDMTAEEEYRAIIQLIQTTNKNMKRICTALEMEPVTTYVARHSFATVLKRSGASVEFISESLGHKSKQTTQNYLANFEDEEKKKWANVLLPDTEPESGDPNKIS